MQAQTKTERRPLPASWTAPAPAKPPRKPRGLIFTDTIRPATVHDCGRAVGAIAPAVEASASGLVPSSTSPSPPARPQADDAAFGALDKQAFDIDPHAARLARMNRAVKHSAWSHWKSCDWPQVMFTLTHRQGETPDSKDVSRFIQCIRNWLLRKFNCRTVRYVWVAELQGQRSERGDAGAVHYHVAVWVPPELRRRANALFAKGRRVDTSVLPKPDKRGWWTKGSSERDWVRKSVTGYLAKYLSKGSDTARFPKGLRIHAAGGFTGQQRIARSHFLLPKWLRTSVKPEDCFRRAPTGTGGGWIAKTTGERLISPYVPIAPGRFVKVTPCNYEQVKHLFLSNLRAALELNFRSKWAGSAAVFA